MKLSLFIKDKYIYILLFIMQIIFIYFILKIIKINLSVIFAVCFVFLVIFILGLAIEYVIKHKYYQKLYETINTMDEKHYIISIIDEPSFLDGIIVHDILRQTTKSMNDKIAILENVQIQYREYIEKWIHEIKNPIYALNISFQNNLDNISSNVVSELDSIEEYVEQALYYARSTNLEADYHVKALDLDSLVKSIIKQRSRQLIKCDPKLKFTNLSHTVYTDEKWFDFILGQIINNCIKYRQGSLELTFVGELQQDNVLLHIIDNGIGIKKSDLRKVFEKGFTGEIGRNYAKSTGIGLYLCKKLCQKMYLGIALTSQKGVGTTVTITFPRNFKF